MMWLDYTTTALLMMRNRPVRSGLSLLGIYIGVLALMVILTIHDTTRRQIEDLYSTQGMRVYLVMPNFDAASMKVGSLTLDDAARLKEDGVARAALPRLTAEREARSLQQVANVQMIGVDVDFIPVYRIPMAAGRNFLASEIATRQPLCLLTQKGAHKLFPLTPPVGRMLDIQGDAFEVIGVAKWASDISMRASVGGEPDVLVPVQWLLQGQGTTVIPVLEVRASPAMSSQQAITRIREVLSHHDERRMALYTVQSLEDYLEGNREESNRLLQNLLAIAAISLLVGGIGVANVMLTSVTERTREVGIRKAIGAKRLDILYQFLVESSVLTVSGGLLAILTGSVGIVLFPLLAHTTLPIFIPKLAIAACLLLTFVIGLIAGVYPASRAASLSPAEALRFE